LALFLGGINALDAPTRQSFVMEIVGRDSLVNAVGLNSAIMSSSRLLGPALGGLIIAAWGVPVCFAINAASFLAVLVALSLMRPAEFHVSARQERPPARILTDLSEALRFVFINPELAGLVAVLATLGTFGFNYSTMIPLFATGALSLGPDGFGLLSAGVGVGALTAALALAGAGRPAYHRVLLAGASFGLLLAAASLAPWFSLAVVLVAAFSCCGSLFSMSSNSMLQIQSPDVLRGRVMGLYTTVVMGATPLGALLTGLLAKAIGIRPTMLTWGGICLFAALLGLLFSRLAASREAARSGSTPAAPVMSEVAG